MQKDKINTGLVWFRNDLRVQDNEALQCAIEENDIVIGLYCFDPRHYRLMPSGFPKTGLFRAKFLIESVNNLKRNLKKLNVELALLHKKPEDIMQSLIEKHKIDCIYYQKEWTQEEVKVESAIKKNIPKEVRLKSFYGQFLIHPEDVTFKIKELPDIFTQFRKKVEKPLKVRSIIKIKGNSHKYNFNNASEIPGYDDLYDFKELNKRVKVHEHSAFPFKGGQDSGWQRINDYMFDSKNISRYKVTRNGLIGTGYSSKFSAWLANGSLSPRQIYWEVKRFEKEHIKNQSTYWLIFELLWRDYFKYISLKYGNAIFRLKGIKNRTYDWEDDKLKLMHWIEGKTGDDFVDANMIEFAKTGFMSNRGRQNVASYFAKELKMDWRLGASYFESQLIDYDVHSNYGNWMYVAGVGNDPRDRKFNTASQAERYDPDKNYRNLWLS